jgi:hypothetical protein
MPKEKSPALKRTYKSWQCMKQRCNNPNTTTYELYGGAGVEYDPDWETFSKFLADMGERPEGTSLDRINNLFGYRKENCRWASAQTQAGNRLNIKISSTGIKGIYRRFNRYRAQGFLGNTTYNLYAGSDFF